MSEEKELSKLKDATLDEYGRINNVPLFLSDEWARISWSRSGNIPWGTCSDHATKYRDMGRMFDDNAEVEAAGVLFELVWSVSCYWLWRYTDDDILSGPTLEHVAQLDYCEDYGIEYDVLLDISESLWDFLSKSKEAQELLIDNRNKQLGAPPFSREYVSRLNVGRYTGTYSFEDILFTSVDEETYLQEAEENNWEFDAEESLETRRKFVREMSEQGTPYVMRKTSRGDPVECAVYELFSLDPRYSQRLSKVVELGPHRDDIDLDIETDYESGKVNVSVTVSEPSINE